MAEIYGREEEKKTLNLLLERRDPQFLAVYGRRRIGKTHLIRHFFNDKGLYFEMTGTKGAPKVQQLFNFMQAFKRSFPHYPLSKQINSWTEALYHLAEASQQITSKERKVILFFDEVPWIETKRSNFLSALEHLWNRYLSNLDNIVLIICGSAASWMIEKVFDNRGGLYGRLTERIHLQPFNLLQTEKFLESLGVKWDRQQVVDLYLAFGGVAKYLTYVKKGWSAAQVIQKQIFDFQGLMHGEFDRLFASLFDHNEKHKKIVEILAAKRKGLALKDIIHKSKLPSGGNSSKIIRELQSSGFLIYLPNFGGKKYKGNYRLTDEYSLFYTHWLLNQKSLGLGQETYWLHMQNSKKQLSWAGYAFEMVCFKHLKQIKKALGISAVISCQTGWRDQDEKGGVEIDLLIERADGCINLVEIKYSRDIFTLGKSEAASLERKKQVFISKTGIKKAVFTTLITPHGVKNNLYSQSQVDIQLCLEDLFS